MSPSCVFRFSCPFSTNKSAYKNYQFLRSHSLIRDYFNIKQILQLNEKYPKNFCRKQTILEIWLFAVFVIAGLTLIWVGFLGVCFEVGGLGKICSKFTGEHPCRSSISIRLQSNSWLSELYLSRLLSQFEW